MVLLGNECIALEQTLFLCLDLMESVVCKSDLSASEVCAEYPPIYLRGINSC